VTADVRAALAPLWPHIAHAVNACIANAIRAGRPETRAVVVFPVGPNAWTVTLANEAAQTRKLLAGYDVPPEVARLIDADGAPGTVRLVAATPAGVVGMPVPLAFARAGSA